jgi:hypothetical protein
MPEPVRGSQPYFNSSVSSTATAVAVYPVRLFYVHAINADITDVFLQLFDASVANVTVGTTTPIQSWLIPGGIGGSNRGAFEESFSFPIQTNAALTIAVTTTATGSSPPSIPLIVNLSYLGF